MACASCTVKREKIGRLKSVCLSLGSAAFETFQLFRRSSTFVKYFELFSSTLFTVY
jgi:hypothetical protein